MVKEAAIDFGVFYTQRVPAASEATGPIVAGAVDGKGIPMVKPEDAQHPVRRTKGKKARPMVPSWEDVLLGTRSNRG